MIPRDFLQGVEAIVLGAVNKEQARSTTVQLAALSHGKGHK
jgi:hypothetical protein